MIGFDSTVWTQIGAAAKGDSSAGAAVIARYRVPVVAYLRSKGVSQEDAEDLAQEVFLRLFCEDLLAKADPTRGRFRAYLLGISRNVLRTHRDSQSAQKRGGDWQRVPLETVQLPAPESDPEFDACWYESLLQWALERLEAENPRQHELMVLHVRGGLSHREIAEQLGRTVNQVKVDMHRTRKRLTQAIKQEASLYASSPEELADELQLFLGSMKRQGPASADAPD